MFFHKITKTKHKFKLELNVAKFGYEPMDKIKEKDNLFKLRLTRGSHKIEIFSHHPHHGKIKFSKTDYQIPMTLYYDEEDDAYLEKELEVKAYVCDGNGNVEKTIGKTELNIADYVQDSKFALEVEIQGEAKKSPEKATVVFHMRTQRQDDDSKSVNTYSDDDSEYKTKESRFKDVPSKVKSKFLEPPAKENNSVKSAQEKKKHFSSEADEKFSYEDTINQAEQFGEHAERSKNRKENKEKSRKKDSVDAFFSRFDLKHEEESKNQQTVTKTSKLKPKDESPDATSKLRTTETSPILKEYIEDSRVKVLEKENSHLKSENQRLRAIISKLVNEKSQKQISENAENNEYVHQIEYYKKVIIEKEMRVNELQNMQKIILEREKEKEQSLKQEKVHSVNLRVRLQKAKHKMAKILQAAMEHNDPELIEFIQAEIQDEEEFF